MDELLTFDQVKHQYFYQGIMVPRSVTGVVKSLMPKFDAMGIIDKYYEAWKLNRNSKYQGLIQYLEDVARMDEPDIKQEIATMWRVNGSKRSAYGTRVHREIETYIKLGTEPTVPVPELGAFKLWMQSHPNLEIVYSELMVYCPIHRVAGTIDLVVRDKLNGIYSIVDFKTCASIDLKSAYGEKALGPAEDLDNCNYVQYAIQLNLYGYLLRVSAGIEASSYTILQLYGTSFAEFSCPDLQSRVHSFMTYLSG